MSKEEYDMLRGQTLAVQHTVEVILTVFLSGMPQEDAADFLSGLASAPPTHIPPANFPWDGKSAQRAIAARDFMLRLMASNVAGRLDAIAAPAK